MTRTSEDKGENVKTSPKIENSSFELRSSFLSFDPFFDENFILKQLKNFLEVSYPLPMVQKGHP